MRSLIGTENLREMAAAATAAPPGDFVEVGVWQGGSAEWLYKVAQAQERRLFLFDTFTGIPYANPELGDYHAVGDFADGVDVELIGRALPGAIVRQGIFPETLTDDVGPIAFAHIDCDQYRSVRDCCVELAPRMAPGGVMWFDDPGILEGASAAVRESFGNRVEYSAGGKWLVRFP